MSESAGVAEGTQSASLFARIVDICDRFEVNFQQGRTLRIEDYLNDSDDSIRPALLRELIALELELRRGQGEQPDLEEYRSRFPDNDAFERTVASERTRAEPTQFTANSHVEARPNVRTIIKPMIVGDEILEELRRGAMDIVYKARQIRLNRLCAVKMILAGDLAGPEANLRFLAEAEAVARLQHPGIVQIYGIGDHNGYPYRELEYVDGGNLSTAIAGTPRPARPAAAMVEALARAVGEAHRRGIVHRDLKPSNVLLSADGQPKVADFGLAKIMDAQGDGLTLELSA